MRVCPSCAHENDQSLTFCDCLRRVPRLGRSIGAGRLRPTWRAHGSLATRRPSARSPSRRPSPARPSPATPPHRHRRRPLRAGAGRAAAGADASTSAADRAPAPPRPHVAPAASAPPPAATAAAPPAETASRPPAVTTPEPAVEEPTPDRGGRRTDAPARRPQLGHPGAGRGGCLPAAAPAARVDARGAVHVDEPAGISSIIKVAERAGRTDLSSQLRANRDEIRRTGVTVAVVGEFKKGKSTLVNALVNAEVCPADPVYAIDRPDRRRPRRGVHGHAHVRRRTHARPSPLDAASLAEVASEAGNDGNHLGLARVDVTAPPPAAGGRPARRRHARRRRARLGDRRAQPGQPRGGRRRRCSSPTAPRS